MKSDDGQVASELQHYLNCETCTELSEWLNKSPNDELVVDALFTLSFSTCEAYVARAACEKLIEQYRSMVLGQMVGLVMRPDYLCSYVLPLCQPPAFTALDVTDFVKPPKGTGTLQQVYDAIAAREEQYPSYSVLVISDWHVDLLYKAGTLKEDCADTICCRSGKPKERSKASREFGETGLCDLPLSTAAEQMAWLSANAEKPDLILWTGDSAPHDMTTMSPDTLYETLSELHSLIKTTYPDVPAVYSLGNHDFEPANA